MMGIQALNPAHATFGQEEVFIFHFPLFLNTTYEHLRYEAHQMKRILNRKEKSGKQKPASTVDLNTVIEAFKEIFHGLFRLCKMALPESAAVWELSFFLMSHY